MQDCSTATTQLLQERSAGMRVMQHTMATPSASESPSSISSDGILQLWDVQEILAERTSGGGQTEILVLWKPSWIAISYMMSEGPVMRRFRAQPKMSFESESGLFRVKLPVEPGTKLAQDFAEDKATVIGDATRAAGHAVVVTMGDHCLGIARTARSGDGAARKKQRRNTGKQ
jgi:hypothetical protein